ncbi:MAG: bacillithiol biosynthesis deacetylase BshB1 [Bacteroidota bacterium]
MKVDILAIAAHPDDVELSCSGTLLRHIDQGKTVALVDLTQGELGTRGSAELRLQEAAEAARIMGAVARENLSMADGFFERSRENLEKIAQVIRKYQPEVVVTNALDDRHPDHGRAAKLVADACFVAGLVKVPTYEEGQLQERWRPHALYHMIQDRFRQPDFVVDITDYLDQKKAVIMAFRSQFYDPDSEELSSPISSKSFQDFLEARARDFGRDIGVDFAEGFNVARTPGVRDFMDLV